MDMERATSMIERLKWHQDRALDVAARAEAMLVLDDPAEAPSLAKNRWEIMRALMPYAAFKHGELFPAMIACARPEQLTTVNRLRGDCLKLGEDLKIYVGRWSSVNVPDHWAEYRSAAIAMIDRLRAHMAREERAADSILLSGREQRTAAYQPSQHIMR